MRPMTKVECEKNENTPRSFLVNIMMTITMMACVFCVLACACVCIFSGVFFRFSRIVCGDATPTDCRDFRDVDDRKGYFSLSLLLKKIFFFRTIKNVYSTFICNIFFLWIHNTFSIYDRICLSILMKHLIKVLYLHLILAIVWKKKFVINI